MIPTTVFLDESGYTRTNLLDPEQPVFVLASHCLPEAEAEEVKQRFFGRVKAQELKYGDLARRPSRQQMILECLCYFDARQADFRFAYVHKPYALMCKVIDWIVEPVHRRQGSNLYDRGGNLALANLLYFATGDLAGPEYRHRLLIAFKKLMERPCPETYTLFGDAIVERCRPTPENLTNPLRQILDVLYGALIELTPDDTEHFGPENLDITVAITLSLMHGWKQARGDTILVHDASSNMAGQADVWNALVSPSVPEALVGWDRRTMEYPLQVHATRFVASPDSAGVQLADILAGAIASCLKGVLNAGQTKDHYETALYELIGPWECVENIWPERKFTPSDLGTDGPAHADPNTFVDAILDGLP